MAGYYGDGAGSYWSVAANGTVTGPAACPATTTSTTTSALACGTVYSTTSVHSSKSPACGDMGAPTMSLYITSGNIAYKDAACNTLADVGYYNQDGMGITVIRVVAGGAASFSACKTPLL